MQYAERLTVPLRWWVQATMLIATGWLAMIVAMPATAAWAITAGFLVLAGGLLLWYGSARVVVTPDELRAGRAHIPLHLLGEPVAHGAEGTRRLMGVDTDVRAHCLYRGYLKRSVQVPVLDPTDPTPYWLISTRKPERLAAALRAHRTEPAG